MAVDAEAILDAIIANADYSLTSDCAKARAYEVAVRQYLALPQSATHGQESVTQRADLRDGLREVQSWLASNCPIDPSTGGNANGAIHYDMTGYRR